MSGSVSTGVSDAAEFFEAYHPRIYQYVLSLMHNPAEAEDVTMEAFLRAHRKQDSLRDAGAAMTWLYRIATNICLDRLRQRTRRAPLESSADPSDLDLFDPDAPSLQKIIEQDEMSACVQQYLADLPDDYRAIILFHDMHGLTGPEIVETLGVSLSTVKIRLHRARLKLRAALKSGCAFSHDENNVLTCEPKP